MDSETYEWVCGSVLEECCQHCKVSWNSSSSLDVEGVLGLTCVHSSCSFGADLGCCLWTLNSPSVGAPVL